MALFDNAEEAETRMDELRRAGHVVAVRYDAGSARVIVDLNTGVQFAFPRLCWKDFLRHQKTI